MSKYSALGDYLKHQRRDVVPMTFAEIEKITSTKLPASSRYRAWWSNNDFNSVLTTIWIKAGFKSEQVDLRAGKLRVSSRPQTGCGGPGHTIRRGEAVSSALWRDAGSHPYHAGHRLTQPADPEWADRLDAQYGKEKGE